MSWNAGAERIFGWTAEEMRGRSIRILIPPDRQQEEDAILAAVSAGRRVPNFETVRQHKDGHAVQVAVTVSPVRDSGGRIVAASKIARDIGEAKRTRARLEDSELRFRMLADNISQLAWITDRDGTVHWYNQRWFDYTGTDLAQMQRPGSWEAVLHPDHFLRVDERWQRHLASGEPWEDTFPLLCADGTYRWFLSRAVPSYGAAGEIANWFGTNTDVTEMREAEQRIELLMMEVNHRSKNMLAIIQALARRTAAQGGDFVARLESRIHALAANQDLLVNRSWSSVPVRDMVASQLGILGDMIRQVDFEGPEVLLSPGAAETIAMAIHEMATNAVKYGALGCAPGRVRIVWAMEPGGDDGIFQISWTERGGPPACEPQTCGFGSRIIADVPRSKLLADVDMAFSPEGFSWILRCSARNVIPGLVRRSPEFPFAPVQ
jgi:PAS domain S-box-containing protein